MEDKEQQRIDFYAMQFNALRAEILGLKGRIIRLLILGVTGIPLIIAAGEKYGLSAVLIVSPLITLVFTFMLVFEHESLMRAGEYIKTHIEKFFLAQDCKNGWEHWLDAKPRRRIAEQFFKTSAYITFTVYYILGTYLAYNSVCSNFCDLFVAYIVVGVYSGGFIIAVVLVAFNLQTSHIKDQRHNNRKSEH